MSAEFVSAAIQQTAEVLRGDYSGVVPEPASSLPYVVTARKFAEWASNGRSDMKNDAGDWPSEIPRRGLVRAQRFNDDLESINSRIRVELKRYMTVPQTRQLRDDLFSEVPGELVQWLGTSGSDFVSYQVLLVFNYFAQICDWPQLSHQFAWCYSKKMIPIASLGRLLDNGTVVAYDVLNAR